MPNPKNIVTCHGKVTGKVTLLKRREDDELFGCRFQLVVPRSRRDKNGKYGNDLVPVKFTFSPESDVGKFASDLKDGDGLVVTGCIHHGPYDSHTPKVYVLAEAISATTVDKRTVEQKPLPY